MRTVSVSAAIIFRSSSAGCRQVFATQRGYGEWKDWWEFPGGKIETGETAQDALTREIREELATEIIVERYLGTVEYDYPAFHLVMHCFVCTIKTGTPTLLEHENARWLSADELDSVRWLPADKLILSAVTALLTEPS